MWKQILDLEEKKPSGLIGKNTQIRPPEVITNMNDLTIEKSELIKYDAKQILLKSDYNSLLILEQKLVKTYEKIEEDQYDFHTEKLIINRFFGHEINLPIKKLNKEDRENIYQTIYFLIINYLFFFVSYS